MWKYALHTIQMQNNNYVKMIVKVYFTHDTRCSCCSFKCGVYVGIFVGQAPSTQCIMQNILNISNSNKDYHLIDEFIFSECIQKKYAAHSSFWNVLDSILKMHEGFLCIFDFRMHIIWNRFSTTEFESNSLSEECICIH